MRDRLLLSVVVASMLFLSPLVIAQDAKKDAKDQSSKETEKKDEKKELTLKQLFPEESFWGTRARGTAFSHDGKYAAYLYRPYIERRHGNDLYLLDTETGEVTRVTSAVFMAKFLDSARKVVEDRTKKAKKAGIGKKDGEKAKGSNGEEADSEQVEKDVADADDPVSGTWKGVLKGGADLGLPPEGVPFTLIMVLDANDAVRGSMSVMGQEVELSGGRFDRRAGSIRAQLVNEELGSGASLELSLDGDELTGKVDVLDMGVSFTVEGKRASRDTGDFAPKSSRSEPFVQDQKQDDDSDGDKTDQDEEKNGDSEEEEKEIILGNWVSEKDAKDRGAPRYSGIDSFVWSPKGHEMLVVAEGDIFRLQLPDAEMTRLTRTQDRESGVQYLPDGSGYSYSGDGGLRKIVFGDHRLHELEPDLPSGENMWGYEISPDGKRMVFITSKSTGNINVETVNIMTFRGRFSQVRQVRRQVSDDPRDKREYGIYLYDFGDPWEEETTLKKIFTHAVSGPRDVLQTPEWSPDSSKIAWAVYTQETGLVGVYTAGFEMQEESSDDASDAEEKKSDDNKDSRADEKNDAAETKKLTITDARLVYKFYHHGGPNTPRMVHPYFLADSHHLTFVTEMSGYRHVHVLDPTYESFRQVTRGPFEVYPFGISDDHKRLFVTSTKDNPSQEEMYVVELENGEMKPVFREDGVYSTTAISNDGSKALANHVTYGELIELQYIDMKREKQRELTDSHPKKAYEVTEPVPEFFEYENRHGHTIHGMMFKPDDWSPEDKRPLLIYVYGGPLGTRKMVVDGSYGGAEYFFAYYMAKKHGYLTVTIDPRGLSGYGAVFEKANFEQAGKPQTEDLVDGAKFLIENYGVDPNRVGIHGWSFGGFQTQMCLYTAPDVFQVGIAGAGPTQWENYNQWYSTGTIGETRVGHPDLGKYSLLPLAKNLKGRLLLVHGMEDSNVLYQDTVKLYRALLQAGKGVNVELFLDPTGGHGLGGDVDALDRYRKYEDFLLRYLGKGYSKVDDDDADDEEEDDDEDDDGV